MFKSSGVRFTTLAPFPSDLQTWGEPKLLKQMNSTTPLPSGDTRGRQSYWPTSELSPGMVTVVPLAAWIARPDVPAWPGFGPSRTKYKGRGNVACGAQASTTPCPTRKPNVGRSIEAESIASASREVTWPSASTSACARLYGPVGRPTAPDNVTSASRLFTTPSSLTSPHRPDAWHTSVTSPTRSAVRSVPNQSFTSTGSRYSVDPSTAP